MNISKIFKETKEKEEKSKLLEDECVEKVKQFRKMRCEFLCNLLAENLSYENNILKAYHDEESGKFAIFYRDQIMLLIIRQLFSDIFGATDSVNLFHGANNDINIAIDSKSLTITPKGSYAKMSCNTIINKIIDLFKNNSSDLLWKDF